MALILNIETATKNCSVALSLDGECIQLKEVAEQGYSHAEKLHLFIEEVLATAGYQYNDLSAVAVSQGPGSYTGLRIGVSAAKGLCFALDLPLIAVDTLEILASKVKVTDGLIVPMIDARRMEVYSAIFNEHHEKVVETQAEIITESSFGNYEEKLYFLGDGSAKCKSELIKPNFIFLDSFVYPSANEMTAISNKKFCESQFADVAYFEPYYLKDFVATSPKSRL